MHLIPVSALVPRDPAALASPPEPKPRAARVDRIERDIRAFGALVAFSSEA